MKLRKPTPGLALAAAILVAAGMGAAIDADAKPAGHRLWKLVWNDEFDGHALDRRKWNVRHNEPRDTDLGCNVDTPANAFLTGGTLTLRALRESVDCAGDRRDYTEPYLDTRGKASWTYGRFEIRAKSPTAPDTSQGLWPAFWMRPDTGANGEIDVIELPGGGKYHDRGTVAIFWDYTPVKQDARLALPAGHPADGFHTYLVEWEPGILRWFFDGTLVWTRNRTTTPWFDAAFSRDYHLRLNFQVGGWPGDPTPRTAFPADFVVDHVRVYQR